MKRLQNKSVFLSLFVILLFACYIPLTFSAERVFAIQCSATLNQQNSFAAVYVWRPKNPQASRSILHDCGDSPRIIALTSPERAGVFFRVVHPVLGLKECFASLPEWEGMAKCGFPNAQMRAWVYRKE